MVLALPLLAVLVLHTSPAVAILLPFALYVPFLVLGLPAGAIVERVRRRTTMIVCNALQLLLFGLVWLLAYLDALTFPMLALLVVLNGCAVVFFQVAYTSYLPGLLVDVDRLHVGNSRLALSESSSLTVGPMVAGPVIQGFGVIIAVAANVLQFRGGRPDLDDDPVPGTGPGDPAAEQGLDAPGHRHGPAIRYLTSDPATGLRLRNRLCHLPEHDRNQPGPVLPAGAAPVPAVDRRGHGSGCRRLSARQSLCGSVGPSAGHAQGPDGRGCRVGNGHRPHAAHGNDRWSGRCDRP